MLGDAVIQAMVATARPDAAKTFYAETLGLKLILDDQFAMQFVGAIGFLRVAKVPAVMPATQAVAAFAVADVDAAVQALAGKGVRFERFAFLQQDAAGVYVGPDGSRTAWFRDPDLNLLSITQLPRGG